MQQQIKIGSLLVVTTLLLMGGTITRSEEVLTPFRKPSLVSHDPGTPAPQRIQRGVAFLREELASPTPQQWGVGIGAPSYLDSGVYQANLVEALGVAGQEARSTLKSERDNAESARLKTLLTLALGLAGDRQTVPVLLKLAEQDPVGMVRAKAVEALILFLEDPKSPWFKNRLAPGEVWQPLDANTKRALERTLLARLDDPYNCYIGSCVMEHMDYSVRSMAVSGLRKLGYGLKWEEPSKTWALLTPQSKRLRTIVRDRPVTAADLPPGQKPRPK